ncbi:MAG: DUF4124 domain-containing protein [Gammaproteobacteria bacterium]|nr:DUF4124 domain-containing protein [Gammaproteobacteria bacterium]
MRFPLFVITTILLSSSFIVQAKTYKWVDEEGQMHFGDKIPSQYLLKEHEELNAQGVVTKHKAAAKTTEEKAEEYRLERERKKIALQEKKKRQRDRVLLDTYTTERDLIVARDSRLDAIDSQINLAETIINDSDKKLAAMKKQITQIKVSNREVPPDLYKKIDSEKQQVLVQTEVMGNHKKRRDKISLQFGDYIERFKILKAEQKAKRERIARERGF